MRYSRAIAAFGCASLLFAASACSSSSADEQTSAYKGAYLYGADANMSNSFGARFDDLPGVLEGMKGTTPMMNLSSEFIARLRAVDPTLQDYTYAAEAYDAVVISALASQLAGTTNPGAISKQINGVTTGVVPCTTVASCLGLAKSGKDLAYRGVTVRFGFTTAGEPSTASYATLHFDASNKLDNGKTEYLNTGSERNATTEEPPKSSAKKTSTDAPLVIGGLLPMTGELAFRTAPKLAGILLAVKEVNAAGGVLGKDVVWRPGDDGTDAQVAIAQIATHKANGVQVLIGTGASGVALAALPEVVKSGMVMFSPSNTATKLTSAADEGLYFRTAPSDILQARALADIVIRDGGQRVVIFTHSSDYGVGLQADVRKELIAAGIKTDAVLLLTYDVTANGAIKDQEQVKALARQATDYKPDGVLVIGYGESADAIKALHAAGLAFRR
jgi:ABC-type branched-subunit amino acid transport system substrate-binding protein